MMKAKPTRSDVLTWWLVLLPLLAVIGAIQSLLGVCVLQAQQADKPIPLWELTLIAVPGIRSSRRIRDAHR